MAFPGLLRGFAIGIESEENLKNPVDPPGRVAYIAVHRNGGSLSGLRLRRGLVNVSGLGGIIDQLPRQSAFATREERGVGVSSTIFEN